MAIRINFKALPNKSAARLAMKLPDFLVVVSARQIGLRDQLLPIGVDVTDWAFDAAILRSTLCAKHIGPRSLWRSDQEPI